MGTRDMVPGAAGSCDKALPLATCLDAGRLLLFFLFFYAEKLLYSLSIRKTSSPAAAKSAALNLRSDNLCASSLLDYLNMLITHV